MNEASSTDVRAIAPITCPHCDQVIALSFKYSVPTINGVLTIDMLEQAKRNAEIKVNALNIHQNQKDDALSWIALEDTLFAPEDVDEVINMIKKQYGST